jgi:hypothetical protein
MNQIVPKLFICLGLFFFYSCASQDKIKKKQLSCFDQYIDSIQNSPGYIEVRTNFLDTFNKWIDAGIKEVQIYKNIKWELDKAVFFNETKDKALLLILEIADSSVNGDEVRIVGAEKINNIWNFYYQSYPELMYDRKNNRKPNSFQYLSNEARFRIITDGYYIDRSCRINYKYIESDVWFTEWRRKMHQDFLKNK